MPSSRYNEVLALLTAIRDERRTHANTANRVGAAMIELLSYMDGAPFLRSDRAENVQYLLTLLQGAVVGESGEIRLNPDGSITCKRIKVDGSAIFDELVFNHQNILEGDTYFTDSAIIDEVIALGDKQYKLIIRKEHENDTVTFHNNDVLECSMNNLDVSGTYKTSWSRVNSVDTAENSVTVILYDDEDVDGGVNYVPQNGAKAIRWGNPSDASRQQTFFVSSEGGRFLFLQGVTQPKLTDGNYAAFIGVPPNLQCLQNLPLNRRQPYVFARGLIVQDIIKIDYQGNPEYTTRELGDWDSARQYLKGYDSVAKGYYIDRVWCDGSLWEAAVALPTIGAKPSLNNADWVRRLHSGADGRDGRDGVDGTDGRDGIDGIDGTDGRDGIDGKDGKDGSDGTSVRTAYSFASYPSDPWEGIVVLIDYDDASSDMIDVLENGVWESYIVDVGSVYICDLDHHYYEATATGWRDCGRFTGADGKDGKDGTDGTDGADGKDGKDGENAVTYEIVPSVPAIKMDSSGTVTTGIIGITAYRTEAGTRTSCSFSASGSKYYIVYFSVDGGQWRACSWIYPGGGAATVYGVPGSYVQSAKVGIAFRLSLHDNNATPAESVVYETQGISVVEDGAKGSNGKAGKNYYYDKYFVSTKEYISTEYQAPYVSFEWQDGGVLRVSQYMLIADSNRVNGVLVAPRTAAAAGVWEVMNHDFNYLITTATFSDFGKLATSVFTGDWRISQYGVPAKAISAAEKQLVRLFVEVDGMYPVSELATMLSEEGAEIYEEYSDFYGYTDEEIDTVADICIWAVGAMPNSTDDERFNIIQSISNSSYQLFGFNPDDPFALFKPNIAEDMLNGKTYLRDVYVRGTIAKNTLRINAGNAQEYCNYGGGGTMKYDRDQMFVNIPAGYEYVQLEFLQDGNGHSAVSGYIIVLLPEITEDMVGSDLIIVNATDSEGETSGKTMTVQSGTANPVGNDGEKNRWLLRGIPKGTLNASVYSSSNPNGSLKRVSLSKQYEVTLRAVPMKVNNVNSGQYGWIVSNLRSIE